MPCHPAVYRGMSGRSRSARREDGTPTRTKVDLLPEATRYLPDVWTLVGQALCDDAVGAAFARRLAPGLEKRFGASYASMRFYPIPTLTRDVTGYRIGIHPDTGRKAITVQLYLPRDRSILHVGTQFHRRLPDGKFEAADRMDFAPSTGYAFAVGDDTSGTASKRSVRRSTRATRSCSPTSSTTASKTRPTTAASASETSSATRCAGSEFDRFSDIIPSLRARSSVG